MMMELSLAKRRAPLTSSKPSMLKDFLLDDLSSCSSNGFRSYPRRQCCTTVRFLLEIDMKNKPTKQRKKKINYNKPQPPIVRSPLKPTGAPISAFQRASEAIINAVKHLPFPSFNSSTKYSSSSTSKLKLGILARSLSRKFLSKRSFWKRNDHKEIQMWGPIISHLTDDEEEENSSPPRDFIVSAFAAAVGGGGVVSSNSSTSESSTTTTNSWSDSDYTNSDESLQSSTANSSTTKIPEEKNKKVLQIDGVVSNSNSSSKRVGVIDGGVDDSMVVNHSSSSSSNSSTNSNSPPNTSKKSWPNEEKEQFSPVSVLGCPFEDDEEDEVSSSSPFQNRLARVEGTKKRLMKKIMRFELLTQLEPVNLVKRIAVSSESDQESIQDEFAYHIEEETTAEKKASEFLDLLKCTMLSPPNNNNNIIIKPNTENLLLDFSKLGYLESEKMEDLVAIAKDWVIGKNTNNEQVLDWKVKKNREMYIRDMEKNGEWRRRNKEKEEVGLEMEVEIFASLISELLDDLLL